MHALSSAPRRQQKGKLRVGKKKNSDPQDERRALGKTDQTSRFSGRKLRRKMALAKEFEHRDCQRRSAMWSAGSQRRVDRAKSHRQRYGLLLQSAILNRTEVADRRIRCCTERFVAGAGLRCITHLCLAKRAANRPEEQKNYEHKHRSPSNGR